MKTCTKCGIEKPLSEFYKRKDKYWAHCKKCDYAKVKKYDGNNKEKVAARRKKYYENNKEKAAASNKRYRLNNPEKVAERKRKYRENNPEKVAAQEKKYRENNRDKMAAKNRRWAESNPVKRAAKKAKNRADKLNRTPPWANHKVLQYFYDEAHRLTMETGIKCHVDHIIPLCGELVSGLHVQGNLQILTERDNISKGNRIDLGIVNGAINA